MITRSISYLTLAAAVFLSVAFASAGESDTAAKGLAIAEEVKRRDTGYGDFSTVATMTLRNAQGQTSERRMRIQTLESPGVGEKSLIVFLSPADTRDTALLSFSYIAESDDQWIYLPAMRRTRRIASGNKSGSFVGSEFSYEDISPQQVEKYTYNYLRDEEADGQDCFVIERFPKDVRSSGYARQVLWIDKAEYRPLKVENYDRRDALLKSLAMSQYKKYEDRFWRPHTMEMVNHQTGKSTDIVYEPFEFGAGLDESLFDQNRLGRGR